MGLKRKEILDLINSMMYSNFGVYPGHKPIDEYHFTANCGPGIGFDNNNFEWFKVHQMCGVTQDGYVGYYELVGEVIDKIQKLQGTEITHGIDWDKVRDEKFKEMVEYE
jgi:hypothetical protein